MTAIAPKSWAFWRRASESASKPGIKAINPSILVSDCGVMGAKGKVTGKSRPAVSDPVDNRLINI